MPDSLAPDAVLPLLRGRFGRPYRYARVCESTQRLFTDDDGEGTVAATEEQTEGRGRLGRTWDAPAGTSVLASVLLEPSVPSDRLPELMLLAGEAVAEAIRQAVGVAARTRFPNDVLVNGRKVAGVLAEASGRRVVLGFGINANQEEAELPSGAEAASLGLESGAHVDRGRLLAAVLEELERRYDAWVSERSGSG